RRGAPRREHGQGVRLGCVPARGRRGHPAARRHRLHVGARPAPLLQARQGIGVHVRRCQVSPRGRRHARQFVAGAMIHSVCGRARGRVVERGGGGGAGGRGGGEEPPSPAILVVADHEEIQDSARQMARTKVEIDRSVLTMRSWARDLGRRLEDSRGALTRADDLRSLGETVGGLAHNLNNSLAAILAYAELMLRESQTPASKRRLSVIRDVALEASATVRRLQEFVSRQPQVALGPVGLPAVIAQAVEMTAPRWRDDAQRRGVSITLTQDMEALPPVEGNALELRDALMRLILNAVAAMPQGGTLAIRAASEESGWVMVEVRDTGVGIPPEVQRRIAERARTLTSGRGPSRGLADVADIVERHGGTLTIESEPGKGT